ncbi:3'-5' exonuclease [Sphingomonas morindae]|uniref:3'-5' exonuclease n=1 Tax=Sphingomonas morindae TaxID=1541170 RepID=A0ABY4XD91_9SPHN|nr:exonuclease domain-containing protein [Sphingomonas morindae]USI74726.1 3'-5' exonuclease [Sphingomonas morindae]
MGIGRIRVIDLETTGSAPPAHGVCEIGWQDVVERDGAWQVDAARGALLIDPGRPIPAVTMAVHHITDADVAGAPFWAAAAPAILRPEGGVIALAAHRAAFEQRFCTPRLTGGAAWICTWKCALRLWPDSPSFSNQVLRYWRRPEGLVQALGLPAHRALPDAYVTAHHLRDMLNTAPLADLLAWSAEPGLLPRVPSGLAHSRHWHELDEAALRRLAKDRGEDVRFSAEMELRRRSGAGEAGGETAAAPPQAQGVLL